MKEKFVNLYIDWATRLAELSYAKRLQVGAVIVKDDTVISYGYNGMPSGWDNNCENAIYCGPNDNSVDFEYRTEDGTAYNLKTRPEVLHAESNAIAKLAKTGNSGAGADIFVTHSPCIECSKLIFPSGISNVYYRNSYRDDAGITFLEKSGINVTHVDK